ncbi:Cyclophilin-like domain [Phytophthora cactorum]|nr:Cyclophilin-like domain [Phytophthora cactorum]
MALKARIKTKGEFQLESDFGPPLVYLDLSVGDQPPRRLHIELFHDELPITTDNFRLLCTGELRGKGKVKALWYKNTRFHRVIPGFMMQGGDITHGVVGSAAALGTTFEDEVRPPIAAMLTRAAQLMYVPLASLDHCHIGGEQSFIYKHQVGAVAMAHQSSSNRSQFFICFGKPSWLDGKHVVFGQVLHDDLPHLAVFETTGSASGRPLSPIVVTDAGQVGGAGFTPMQLRRPARQNQRTATVNNANCWDGVAHADDRPEDTDLLMDDFLFHETDAFALPLLDFDRTARY